MHHNVAVKARHALGERSPSRCGFTLVELLLSIGIISVISGVVITAVNVPGMFTKSYDTQRKSDAKAVQNALYSQLIEQWELQNNIEDGSENANPICKLGVPSGLDPSCIALDSLVPDFISCLPYDTAETEETRTGFEVYSNAGRPVIIAAYLGSQAPLTSSCDQDAALECFGLCRTGEYLITSNTARSITYHNGYLFAGGKGGYVGKMQVSDMGLIQTSTVAAGINNHLPIAVNDGTYAYFGEDSWPGRVHRVDMNDLSSSTTLPLNGGENEITTICMYGGNLFLGLNQSPAKIVKVSLSPFQRQDVLVLPAGESSLTSCAVDSVNGFAYFGTGTSPGKVIKIDLNAFTRVGALTLNAGENRLEQAGVIDVASDYAYFGARTVPGRVVRIRLSDFTHAGTLVFGTGEDSVISGVIDLASQIAFFGLNPNPGGAVQVNLSDFSKGQTLFADAGEHADRFYSAAIDSSSRQVFFGTQQSLGVDTKVLKFSY
ncbi:MAG TPA: type II secretion system protein [Candidatus Peribacterales bacterium]|nr:type II secretion system protein [Candidatus Peribacterales bacterium]